MQEQYDVRYKIIDTNILLTDAKQAIYGFGPKKPGLKNVVIIHQDVLNELDRFKKESSDRGANARMAFRILEKLQRNSEKTPGKSLYHGVEITPDYEIQLSSERKFEGIEAVLNAAHLDKDVIRDDVDGRLIKLALQYTNKYNREHVELISNDVPLRVNAFNVGVDSKPWEDYTPVKNIEEIYKGWRETWCEPDLLDKFNHDPNMILDPADFGFKGKDHLWPNEYVILSCEKGKQKETGLAKFQKGRLVHLSAYKSGHALLSARNNLQECLMDALRDPSIDLVFAIGAAGTGKTLLSLEAGLMQVTPYLTNGQPPKNHDETKSFGTKLDIKGALAKRAQKGGDSHRRPKKEKEMVSRELATIVEEKEHKNITYAPFTSFERILVARPAIGVDKKEEYQGYAPGTIDDKLSYFLQPVMDNFWFLMDLKKIDANDREEYRKLIEICSIFHVRGRNLMNYWFLIDESQNIGVKKMFTLLTRIGEGTKTVVNGDLEQIDADFGLTNNGLSIANQAHKEDDRAAAIFIPGGQHIERSERTKRSRHYMQQIMKKPFE